MLTEAGLRRRSPDSVSTYIWACWYLELTFAIQLAEQSNRQRSSISCPPPVSHIPHYSSPRLLDLKLGNAELFHCPSITTSVGLVHRGEEFYNLAHLNPTTSRRIPFRHARRPLKFRFTTRFLTVSPPAVLYCCSRPIATSWTSKLSI